MTAEAAKEIKYVVQVLELLILEVDKPIIVHNDNVGAIFVAENAFTTKQTCHIDVHCHFVHENIIDGHIKIIFVMSKANLAAMITKNGTSEIYKEHIDNFLVHRQVIQLTLAESAQFFESGGVSEMTKIINELDKLNQQKGNQKGNHSCKYIDKYLLGMYVPVDRNKTRNQNGSNNE